jgi:hypothetical protein
MSTEEIILAELRRLPEHERERLLGQDGESAAVG